MHLPAAKRLGALSLAGALALGLAACGETVATGSFKGEEEKVAQRISKFQSDASKGDERALCREDLAAPVTARLGASESSCQRAIKDQLTQIEVFTLSIDSITLSGERASAVVKSTYAGKIRPSTLSLVKEGGSWKISALR